MADDEERLRQVVVMMLEELGAEVIAVDTCEEAIEIFSGKGAEIDVLMLDLKMKGMDGDEAYDVIRGIDRDARVVLVSGLQPEREVLDKLARDKGAFMEKPFDMDLLGKVLAEVVDRKIEG